MIAEHALTGTMKKKEHKILLIEPPFARLYNINAALNRLPLSLGYLAGTVCSRRPNWRVHVYNSDFSPLDLSLGYEYMAGKGFDNYRKALSEPGAPIWKEIEDTMRRISPSVVGITAKSQNFASACNIARIAKSVDQSSLVVFGGPHATLIKRELLKNSTIDIGVFGEGEETLVEILDAFEGREPLSTVKGIVYRDGDKAVETQPRELIPDLDSLPYPVSIARKCLIDYDKYPAQAFKYVFAVRGCPFDCAFCGSRYTWTRRVRYRSVDNVIEEIQEIQKLGVDYLHFDDDTWGVKKSYIRDLCSAIKKHCPGLSWSCEIHVKFADDETIALMKSAGCRRIQIGVESGNNEMLKLIKKGITIEEAVAAAKIIKKHKICLSTFFIVGFPQETEESLRDTISAMTSIPTDMVIYSIFTPYFGTELFEYCKQNGTVSEDFDFSRFNHQSPENYFCTHIPQEVFRTYVRELERKVDGINSRKNVRMYLSREGYRKFKERGFKRGVLRLMSICWSLFK